MVPISLTTLKELAAWLFGRTPEYRGLVLGLDASGKTTLLYQLRLPNEKITTMPTIGFNVEMVESSKGHKFTLWDIGGTCCQIIRDTCHSGPKMQCFANQVLTWSRL
jgi:hypothetical protein